MIKRSLSENRLWIVDDKHGSTDSGPKQSGGADFCPLVQWLYIWLALRNADCYGGGDSAAPETRALYVAGLFLHLPGSVSVRPGQHVLQASEREPNCWLDILGLTSGRDPTVLLLLHGHAALPLHEKQPQRRIANTAVPAQ